MSGEYAEFLRNKERHIRPSGHEPENVSDFLYPFQRDIVRWATRLGRAAIFAECGLGKTLSDFFTSNSRKIPACRGKASPTTS